MQFVTGATAACLKSCAGETICTGQSSMHKSGRRTSSALTLALTLAHVWTEEYKNAPCMAMQPCALLSQIHSNLEVNKLKTRQLHPWSRQPQRQSRSTRLFLLTLEVNTQAIIRGLDCILAKSNSNINVKTNLPLILHSSATHSY